MNLVPGTLLHNRYRIVSTLGSGGMGAVYRATDEHLLIQVAVKENLYTSEEYGRQFQREAHILAGLRHPNLPHVSDYFVIENQGQYLVMDYIEGEDLRQRMERMGPLPEREAMLIGISICDALTYLHTRRLPIIHRDIKPGNIKVTPDGQAVLVDFGLAKIMQSDQKTVTGARAMTPGYSPPEQYGTARTDCRSDIYSLGATLYATLTGIIPEDGLERMTGKAKLIPTRDLVPKINRKLADTIETALDVEPDRRFQNAEEFKKSLIESGELTNFYQERPTISPPPTLTGEAGATIEEGNGATGPKSLQHASRRKRRTRASWLALPSIAVTVIAFILLLVFRSDMTRGMFAYFTASPPGNSPTSISGVTNPSPTLPVDIATTTPMVGSSSSGQPLQGNSTPSLTPTITLTPTVTLTLAPSATPRGGGYGQIAFTSDRSGSMEIWLMDISTKKYHRITNQRTAGACQPAWSPDGMRLAFTSPCQGKQDNYQGSSIYAINLDAAGNPIADSKTQLTFGLEGDFDPAWSPDGSRIVYTSLVNEKPSIYMLNLQTLVSSPLYQSLYSDRQPAWSPDGMSIAFVRQVAASRQIWTMSDNGELQKQFSPAGPTINAWPTWSPDGEIIFYSQTQNSPDPTAAPSLIYLRTEDRGKQKEYRVPTNPKSNIGPVAGMRFSPDGFWLAYESWPDGQNHDIYMMSLSGSDREQLTTDPGKDFGVAWRPFVVSQPAAAQP